MTPIDLQNAWNAGTSLPVPRCREMTGARIRRALARLSEAPWSEWQAAIAAIEQSPFCRGTNDRGWTASFDWFLQPDTRVKVLEGKYAGTAKAVGPRPQPTYLGDWFEDCKAQHNLKCGGQYQHGIQVRIDAYRQEDTP